MKKRILNLLLSACLVISMTACGQTAVKEDPCKTNGHKWIETTPNYQQPKTCEICGATEGESLKALNEGIKLVEENTKVDMKMILDGNPEKTNTAKVWFDNYKIFDSDETHEAKEGYEWRSVDLHIAIGDDREYQTWDTCNEANYVGEYYQDNDWVNDCKNITVNYYGKDYVCDHVFTVLNEERNVTKPEYKEFGWSGEKTYTFEYNDAFLVPKGFDGMLVGFYDSTEFEQKNKDFYALENIVNFRLK